MQHPSQAYIFLQTSHLSIANDWERPREVGARALKNTNTRMESLRGLGNALSDAGKKEVRDDTSGASSFVVFDQQRRPSMDVQTAQTNGQPRQHAAPRRNMSYDASTFSAREPGRKVR